MSTDGNRLRGASSGGWYSSLAELKAALDRDMRQVGLIVNGTIRYRARGGSVADLHLEEREGRWRVTRTCTGRGPDNTTRN